MTFSGELLRRTRIPALAGNFAPIWRPRFALTVLVSTVALVAGLVLAASPSLAAPSAVPDSGTVQVDGRINAILPVGNRIYLGGEFTHVNGITRNYLAAVDATTGQLTNWAPGANARVKALAASPDGSRIYAGGSFSQVDGLARWRLVSLDAATGAVDPNWKPTSDSGVHALAVDGNRLYVGGSFLSIDGQSRQHLALLDRGTGAVDPGWNPVANNNFVRSLALSPDGSRVYAGGDFTSVSGRARPYLASLSATTGAPDIAFNPPSPNGEIFGLAMAGGRVYTAEGGPGGAMAAYDTATGARAWRNSADGDAESITTLGNRVYVAGHFEVVGSQARGAFAALDPSTGALDPNWTPVAEPAGTDVWALASDASRGRVYAGGDFTSVSGQARQRFAQFSDPSATSDTTPPTVGNVAPADGGTSVTLSSNVGATFSEAMDASTINGTTFTLIKQGTTSPVAASVSYDGSAMKATLDPTQNLEANSTYTANIKGGATGARDLAGNALGADKSWTFTTGEADTSPPDTTITSGPTNPSRSASASFGFSSSETGSTFECSLDGAAYTACTSSNTYTGLTEGSHTFRVKATDAAGNTDPTPASETWTVDTVAPETTIDSGPSGTVSVRSATFTFSSPEVSSAFECSLDGVAFDTCTSPKEYTGLSNGSHTFRVRAKDPAGNTDGTPASRTWKVRAK